MQDGCALHGLMLEARAAWSFGHLASHLVIHMHTCKVGVRVSSPLGWLPHSSAGKFLTATGKHGHCCSAVDQHFSVHLFEL